MSRFSGSLAGLLALLALTTACSSSIIVEQFRGGRVGDDERPAALLRDDGLLAVITMGSSGCPVEPVAAEARGPHQLVITLRAQEPPAGAVCTADLAPTWSLIRLPSDIAGPPLTVDFRGDESGLPHTVTVKR
jgi:hypothetical protein